MHHKRNFLTTCLICCMALSSLIVQAATFRAPSVLNKGADLPVGAQLLEPPSVFPRAVVEQQVHKLFASWNTPQFAKMLGESYYEKDRLLDTISEKVPRDAQLKVVGIDNMRMIRQYTLPVGEGKHKVVSHVEVRVRGQMEFNDPSFGFIRLPGSYTMNLRITDIVKAI